MLGKDNYVAWSCKIEDALVVADLWDLVSGHRVKPVNPTKIKSADGTANANRASIDAATREFKAFTKASAAVTSLFIKSISDTQMYHVRSVIKDPVAT